MTASASAQLVVFYGDVESIGRIDSPPLVGPLEADLSGEASFGFPNLAVLPGGQLIGVDHFIYQFDPETLDVVILDNPGHSPCFDITADAVGNLWCVVDSFLFRLAAATYETTLTVQHPADLDLVGTAYHDGRVFVLGHVDGEPDGNHTLYEVDQQSGALATIGGLPLPTSEQGFFAVQGMDFDDNGDLWLGLHLFPDSESSSAPVPPPLPEEGHLARVLDPLGAAEAQPAQRLVGTIFPSPLVLGAPSTVDVPAADAAGLALLAALLLVVALARIRRF